MTTILLNLDTRQLIMVPRGRQHDAIVRCLQDAGAQRLPAAHLATIVERAVRLRAKGLQLPQAVDLALRTIDPQAAG
jgi:hypothetical protein